VRTVRYFLLAALLLCIAHPRYDAAAGVSPDNHPQTLHVRLWHLHPPNGLIIHAEPGHAQLFTCKTCKPTPLTDVVVRAVGPRVQIDGSKSNASDLRITGEYQLKANEPAIRADFPVEISAADSHLLVTATMPMEEYVAGVLAGETGNFKSDEALKAMAVAAQTYAVHFGTRHALDGFDFCDTTHCQDLRLGGINEHLRAIANETAGEVLWYDGEPAATYYYANCGGTTEDGRYILGSNEARAPYLTQHSDQYCRRNGGSEWHSEVTKRELQRALSEDGIEIPGTLRSVTILDRTSSGRVEMLRVTGSRPVTVPGVAFRSAVGRHIGWERLKSNLYEVSDRGDRLSFHGRGLGHGVGLCQIGAEIMGEEGRSYREILSFYYPGTKLGVAAQGLAWQQFANEDIELLTTRPERDRGLLTPATRELHAAEESTGLIYRAKPRLKVYATIAEFRNATGEPGWVAASTRGRTIQMQPPEALRDSGALESTLRHELLHMLIESYAHPGTPLWLREGLALYLSKPNGGSQPEIVEADAAIETALRAPQSEQQLRAAYAQARARVARLVQEHGKASVLDWLREGLPASLASAASQVQPHVRAN
jgi:stage II sporulation protein D